MTRPSVSSMAAAGSPVSSAFCLAAPATFRFAGLRPACFMMLSFFSTTALSTLPLRLAQAASNQRRTISLLAAWITASSSMMQ